MAAIPVLGNYMVFFMSELTFYGEVCVLKMQCQCIVLSKRLLVDNFRACCILRSQTISDRPGSWKKKKILFVKFIKMKSNRTDPTVELHLKKKKKHSGPDLIRSQIMIITIIIVCAS